MTFLPFITSNPKHASIGLREDQLREIFWKFDKNHDKVLSREEVREAFKYLGAMLPGFRANRGINHADANGDGKVDMSELNELVKYALGLGYSVK